MPAFLLAFLKHYVTVLEIHVLPSQAVYRAFFYRSGTYISFSVNLLPSWEFAFAMTVHKSQGSEFDDVLLVLPDAESHRLLTREIVYTGNRCNRYSNSLHTRCVVPLFRYSDTRRCVFKRSGFDSRTRLKSSNARSGCFCAHQANARLK